MSTAVLEHGAWSRPGLHAQVVRKRRDGRCETVLHVDSVHTPHQVLRLESHLQCAAGLDRFDLDRAAQRLRVTWDPGQTSLPDLLAVCANAGCTARPLSTVALDITRRQESHAALKRLVVAGLFAMQAMMFASVLYFGHFERVDSVTRELFRWLGLLAAAPVVLWAALPFYRQTLSDLRHRRLGTEAVVALAVGLIFLASILSTVRGYGAVYFESISMLVFVLLLGRYLELRARHRSGALGEAAADAEPIASQRRKADGSLEWVAVAELEKGDAVHVAEGGVIPADGRVANATVLVDEALLSGESTPRKRNRGQPLVAGSVVVTGPLEMIVEQGAATSALAALGALACQAGRQAGLPTQDRAAARFASRVLVLTVLSALFWLWFDPSRAFDAAVAVLVVACPCAFALAAPVVASRAISILGQRGVWVTRASALAVLARADHAAFDKTGTLTEPHLDRDNIKVLRGGDSTHLLHLAASLARESRHPLSRLITEAAGQASLPVASDVEIVDGGGVRGLIDGRKLRLGRAGFVSDQPIPDEYLHEALLLADEEGLLAVFPLHEQPRDHVVDSLAALANDGMQLQILSGDAAPRVDKIARRLKVRDWHARMSPQQKLELIQSRRTEGAVVLAVGDGSNDAPFLAAADVSAAMVSGTELAQAHADLLLTDGIRSLPLAQHIARSAQRILQQNRRGSLIYNFAAVPFAAAGLVPPWLAVIGMSLSSLCVVLNALRIRAPKPPAEATGSPMQVQPA